MLRKNKEVKDDSGLKKPLFNSNKENIPKEMKLKICEIYLKRTLHKENIYPDYKCLLIDQGSFLHSATITIVFYSNKPNITCTIPDDEAKKRFAKTSRSKLKTILPGINPEKNVERVAEMDQTGLGFYTFGFRGELDTIFKYIPLQGKQEVQEELRQEKQQQMSMEKYKK